tara:strand:- start:6711 stop:9584 length:2874 start_codon:yes stop_codon:yes gene_type:complete
MATYRDMMELIGKVKHVPTVLANIQRFSGLSSNPGYSNRKFKTGGTWGVQATQGLTSNLGSVTGSFVSPYSTFFGEGVIPPSEGGIGVDEFGNVLSGKTGGGGYQGLTPYEGGSVMAHSLISPRVTSFKEGGKVEKKSETLTEEDFKFTSWDDLTKEQKTELLSHFKLTEGYKEHGHLVTDGSGITFGSGLDVMALTKEKDLIKHGVSKEDAKTIMDGLKYTKKDGKVYNMAGKDIATIKKDLGWDNDKLEEYVENIKFSSTTQEDIVSLTVNKNYNNNSDLFDKVSNFEDFTVLSSLIHFTGDSHLESDIINRNTGGSTKRAMQITLYELMNKYDDQLSSEEFNSVLHQTKKIVDDTGGIGVRTDTHSKGPSATFNRMNKELDYSTNTLGEDYIYDETKYYTINIDDLGAKGSSKDNTLTIHDATYVEPVVDPEVTPEITPTEGTEVLPTEGMNVTPTQDISVQGNPDPNLTPSVSEEVQNPYLIEEEYAYNNPNISSFKKGGKFNTGGKTEEETNPILEYSKSAASKDRGAFPRMRYEDSDRNPNLNVGKNAFLAIAMARYYGYDGEIKMTSGQRGGKDQTRVYGIYQRDDAHVYGNYPEYQQAIADSLGVTLRDYKRNNVSDEEWDNQDVDYMTDWINNIWHKVISGEMTMEEADKLYPMEHMTGDAGDFVGEFKQWLKDGDSGKNKKAAEFIKDFNVDVLDEHDHFHVTFGEISVDNLPKEHQADYYQHEEQFNTLSVDSPDVMGTRVINMNPSVYQGEDRYNLYSNVKIEPISIKQISPDSPEPQLIEMTSPPGWDKYQEYRKDITSRRDKSFGYKLSENLGAMESYNDPRYNILSYEDWAKENNIPLEQETVSPEVNNPYNPLNPQGHTEIQGQFSQVNNPYTIKTGFPTMEDKYQQHQEQSVQQKAYSFMMPTEDEEIIKTKEMQWWEMFNQDVRDKASQINNMINPYQK